MTRTSAPRWSPRRRSLAAATALASLVAMALTTAARADASPAAPAQLSVTLTDGVSEVHSDSDVHYSATVTNQGTRPITTRLVLTAPGYVNITRAPGARVAAHSATWRITVPASKSVTRTAAAHIATIAKGDYRVTTLASVYATNSAAGVPLIRTAVANTITGVTDPARTVKPTSAARQPSSSSSSSHWPLWGGGFALALLLLGAGGWGWSRRRRGAGAGAAPTPAISEPDAVLSGASGRHRASQVE